MSNFIDKLNRFAGNPVNMNMKRSKFNLSHGHKLTMVAGKLVPILVEEVLPDDTFKINLASVVRSITPAVPVMDNAYLDVYAFWVPARLTTMHDKDWQKVHGENVGGFWAQSSEETLTTTGNVFTLPTSSDAVAVQSLADYLGIPVGFYHSTMTLSKLVFNGYFEIWNQWFRDENTQAEISWRSYTDAQFRSAINTASNLLDVNKFHDYFTSALPSPQKGASVLLPITGNAPVVTGSVHMTSVPSTELQFVSSGFATSGTRPLLTNTTTTPYTSGTVRSANATFDGANNKEVMFSNLWADLSSATAVSVNEMRQAFAIQKLFEKDARGGTRYREVLMTHFGVSIPDNTVQVPEYLGGKRIPLNQLQVLQSTPTTGAPVGTTGAFSNTSDVSDLFVKSFAEFGYVYVLACIRNNQSYSQGISKLFTRNRRFDFYYPVFANLGEQAVKATELYANNSSVLTDVFGYQECWAEYRFKPTKISGYLSANSGDSVAQSWTYGNKFTAKPVLNSSFMKQSRTQIDNTLVVNNANYQFICDFWFNFTAWRAMPYYSIPGLIDHH